MEGNYIKTVRCKAGAFGYGIALRTLWQREGGAAVVYSRAVITLASWCRGRVGAVRPNKPYRRSA